MKTLFKISIIFILMSCSQDEVLPVSEYRHIDDELQSYVDDYLAECEKYGTQWQYPISFTMILSDSIGSANGLGAGVTLRYKSHPGKVRLLITDEMSRWSENSRRYVIFHELGHALRGLDHHNHSYAIMNKYLYPSLDKYLASDFVRDIMEENHFLHGH